MTHKSDIEDDKNAPHAERLEHVCRMITTTSEKIMEILYTCVSSLSYTASIQQTPDLWPPIQHRGKSS